MSDNVKKGDVVRAASNFNARGFEMTDGEKVGPDFSAFSREGRTPKMIQVHAGQTLTAVTDSNDLGWFYAPIEHEGKTFALLMVTGWERVKAAA